MQGLDFVDAIMPKALIEAMIRKAADGIPITPEYEVIDEPKRTTQPRLINYIDAEVV